MTPPGKPLEDYWNDEAQEQAKRYFWLEDGQDLMLRYLREITNLERGLAAGLTFAMEHGGPARSFLEVAAGVGWAAALGCVAMDAERVLAFDISRHRLRFAPAAWKALGADPARLRVLEADFLRHRPEGPPYDAVLFCQGAYMFQDLPELFAAARLWLKPGGWVLVANEAAEGQGDQAPAEPDVTGRWTYGAGHYASALEQAGFTPLVQDLPFPIYPALAGQGNARNILGIASGEKS